MRKSKLLEELELEAKKRDIIIRYEDLGLHKGGLCRLFGRYFLIVNRGLKTKEKAELIAGILREQADREEHRTQKPDE